MISTLSFACFTALSVSAGVGLLAIKLRVTHLLLLARLQESWPLFVRHHGISPEASAQMLFLAKCYLPVVAVEIVFGRARLSDPFLPAIVPALRTAASCGAGVVEWAPAGPDTTPPPICWVCGGRHAGGHHE